MAESTPTTVIREDGRHEEIYALPTEEGYLHELIEYIFTRHWQGLVFGPIIEGAAFEITCEHAPVWDCPAPLRAKRRTARAELVRGLDRDGAPLTWSLRLLNGAGEQQLTVFFPNPFLTDDDRIAETPNWRRLAAWEDIAAKYLDRAPDPRDRSGRGFADGCS